MLRRFIIIATPVLAVLIAKPLFAMPPRTNRNRLRQEDDENAAAENDGVGDVPNHVP